MVDVYEQMEPIVIDFRNGRTAVRLTLAEQGTSDAIPTEEEIRAIAVALRRSESALMERYVELQLQLQLRELLTEDEFNRIDALR